MEVQNQAINKGGIKPVPIDSYKISAGDVINYLKTQVLGFDFKSDIRRWRGVSDSLSYVRMRCIFAKNNILVDAQPKTFVDKVISDSNLQFNDSVIRSLTPFMYPTRQNMLRTPVETLQKLQLRGVYGNRLEELINYCEFKYNDEIGVFMIYLRPEAIITDMLKNPVSGEINGNMSIVGVTGEDESDLVWYVEVRKAGDTGLENISIDSIFNKK